MFHCYDLEKKKDEIMISNQFSIHYPLYVFLLLLFVLLYIYIYFAY